MKSPIKSMNSHSFHSRSLKKTPFKSHCVRPAAAVGPVAPLRDPITLEPGHRPNGLEWQVLRHFFRGKSRKKHGKLIWRQILNNDHPPPIFEIPCYKLETKKTGNDVNMNTNSPIKTLLSLVEVSVSAPIQNPFKIDHEIISKCTALRRIGTTCAMADSSQHQEILIMGV